MTETVYILLKFRGSKKAKLTQQPIELKRKKDLFQAHFILEETNAGSSVIFVAVFT
jgi:hypothetical protein